VSTGRKTRIPGFKADKSGTRIVPDLKRLDVSKRLQKKGAQKMKFGRRGK
jgi:hypothetical protein